MKYFHILCACLALNCLYAEISYPDFVVSMTRKGHDVAQYERFFGDTQEAENALRVRNLEVFRNIYMRNVLIEKRCNDWYRIPKIIHQIWLGSPIPAKYFAWMSTWMHWHGWEYKLWTDENIQSFPLYNQELYDKATNFGEKSDILRLELLLHYGGIYVDIDFECVNPSVFDEINRSFDFFIGFEPIDHGTLDGMYKLCNAILGATPHHPIINNLVVNMRSNCIKHQHDTVVQKTGPDYISRVIFDYEKGSLSFPENKWNNSQYRNMYLPCTFLYPFSEPDIRSARSHEELISKISPETGAIHYWSGSWFIPGGR